MSGIITALILHSYVAKMPELAAGPIGHPFEVRLSFTEAQGPKGPCAENVKLV